ncbi:MAG TPA: 5'-3' exonuclease [Jatrophihabitantaceae bacterium]
MLMLIDAANLYFRAFHALPDSIKAPDGTPVNAIRGYLDMTASLIDKRRPTRHVACLDASWRPAFRVKLVPSYKAHRIGKHGGEDVPDALIPQIPLLMEVLAAVGMVTVGADGFEADDVIATLCARDEDTVEVVSGDRDLLAVANDRVTVLYTGKGIAKMEAMGPDQVQARYGIPASHYADFAVLRGDPSDGLPGVPGVGEKTAAALVAKFGTVEEIVTAAEDGSPGFPSGAANKILAARDYLALAPDAVRGRVDVPVGQLNDALPAEPADPERLVRLADELAIEAPVNRLLNAIAAARA